MTDDDIHAFPSDRAPASTPPARASRGSLWPWVLLALFVLMLLVAASGASLLLALADGAREGVNITIDGERWGPFDLDEEHGTLVFAGLALALMVALVLALVAVPFTVLLALLAAALGIAVALLALLTVAAVALSPLWLAGLGLWLILRRRPAAAATMRG